MPGGHLGHAHGKIRFQEGGQGFLGGFEPGGIGVETEDHLVGEPLQNTRLLLGEGGSLRGRDILDARFEGGDEVDLAFANNGRFLIDERPLGFVDAKKHVPFNKERRFRGVDVFAAKRLLIQHPPAERDHLADVVADREHQAVAEPVVEVGRAVRVAIFPLVLIFLHRHQAARNEFVVVETLAACPVGERIPRLGGVPELPVFGHLHGEAPALEVIPRALRRFRLQQIGMKPLRRRRVQREQAPPQLLLGVLFGAKRLIFHANPRARGQAFGRLGEFHVFVKLHELEHAAARAASEAFEDLPGGIDTERGRFLLVKGAARLVSRARPLQGEIARDHIDDVVRLRDLL